MNNTANFFYVEYTADFGEIIRELIKAPTKSAAKHYVWGFSRFYGYTPSAIRLVAGEKEIKLLKSEPNLSLVNLH